MTAAVAGCIFCRIATGDAEASIVFEDELTIAFLDIRQLNPGHTLVIPKRHVVDIYGVDDAVGGPLMMTVARGARAVRDALEPEGINVSQSTGAAAGQEVFHVHFHVLPRYTDDGLLRFSPSTPGHPARAEINALAAKIAAGAR